MSESIRRESPLVERNTPERHASAPADAGVRVREYAFRTIVNVRGNAEEEAFTKDVANAVNVELPLTPNTVNEGDRIHAIWLGPDEWYLVGEPDMQDELVAALETGLSGQHHAVNDQTSGLTTLVVSGPNARDVLEKGCTLDLHPRVFADGQCAQTLISHAGVVIRPLDSARSYEIMVRRSFADYLWIWLEDAAAEFGFAAQA